jgi:hypothetical protein
MSAEIPLASPHLIDEAINLLRRKIAEGMAIPEWLLRVQGSERGRLEQECLDRQRLATEHLRRWLEYHVRLKAEAIQLRSILENAPQTGPSTEPPTNER